MAGSGWWLFFLGSEDTTGTRFGFDDPLVLLLLGAGIVSIMLLRRKLRQKSRAQNSVNVRPDGVTAVTGKNALKGETDKLVVELHELGREIEGRLETRIRHLTRLISEADNVIEKLNATVAAARNCSSDGPNAGAEGDGNDDAEKRDSIREQIKTLSQAGKSPREIADIVEKPVGEVSLILGLEKT